MHSMETQDWTACLQIFPLYWAAVSADNTGNTTGWGVGCPVLTAVLSYVFMASSVERSKKTSARRSVR